MHPNACVWGSLESCINLFTHHSHLLRVQPVLRSLVHGDWAGGRRRCSANWEGFPTSHSEVVLATCGRLLFVTLGLFLLSLRRFCRIRLETGIDGGRLTSEGKKLCSWAAVCTQSLAASLNHHGVQTNHPDFSGGTLFFREGEEGRVSHSLPRSAALLPE